MPIENEMFRAKSTIYLDEVIDPQLEEETGIKNLRLPTEENPYTPEEVEKLDTYVQKWETEFEKARELAYHEVWELFLQEYPHHDPDKFPPQIDWEWIKLAIDESCGYEDDVAYKLYIPTVFTRLDETVAKWYDFPTVK